MNKFPGVTEMLALLDKLKGALESFAAREERLTTEYRTRSVVETRASEAETSARQAQQAEELARAEADFAARKERSTAAFSRRKARINEAHKTLRRTAVDAISSSEGRRKHKLQQSALEAEARRNTERTQATARFEEFKQKLNDSHLAFAQTESQAAHAFRGFRSFKQLLAPERNWPEPDLKPDEEHLFEELCRLHQKVSGELKGFGRNLAVRLARFIPPAWLLGVLLAACLSGRLPSLQNVAVPYASALAKAEVALGVLFVLRVALYHLARAKAAPRARAIAADLARARHLHAACTAKAEQTHQREQEQVKTGFDETTRRLDQEWKEAIKDAIDQRDLRPRQLDEKAGRIARRHEDLQPLRLERIERSRAESLARLASEHQLSNSNAANVREAKLGSIQQMQDAQWQTLAAEWRATVQPICETLSQAEQDAAKAFPEWQQSLWEHWTPPAGFTNAAKFGSLEVDAARFPDAAPRDPRLALPCGSKLTVPLLLTYPLGGSVLLETSKSGGEAEAIAAINCIIYRLLSTIPPGKVSFTIFDPIGLGENFAGLMHLADYEASHINSRIWTQTTQFEEKLGELNEHIEKVIQMYLRNEYETITEYNAQAGAIAEKYHFLIIASFPANFSDTAGRRLRNIAASGARCGVYTVVHWDQRLPLPQDFVPDELRKHGVALVRTERGFEIAGRRFAGTRVVLDPPPSPEFATQFLHRVGESSKDAGRVEVPFADIAPAEGERWQVETTEELRVPIGRTGATKLQYLAIGKATRQHALIAGKTGSGKSTLFHVIVTNLALWCSPEQVEFYLVDFKKGVEFKCYATRRLPHARVVAIESDRQFGLSVLERVDAELHRRGDLFRKLGVQDLPGYKRAGGTEVMPRSLLMIDEFQELFVEDDRVSQSAAVLLDRIVRQGRAFGIHVILGSQTLGGAYTLARATIGQMVIRVALQCNEADAYLIMDQDNPAPRLLSRPGEGIYNDAAGAIEGNNPFQVVWLPEEVRDEALAAARALADRSPRAWPGPFVFEGNAPADVRDNALLAGWLTQTLPAETVGVKAGPATPRIWLGAPNSIKGPTEAVFQKQSASNLLIVGQSEEPTLVMLALGLIALAVQYPPEAARFILLDLNPPGSPHRIFLDRVMAALPHQVLQPKPGDFPEVFGGLAEDLKNASASADESAASAPVTFLFINGLQGFKKMRQEDEFSFSSGGEEDSVNPAKVFMSLVTEGPAHGFHIIAACDTFNNVSRFLGRKALSEFSLRVLFQMSASDSAALIDAPDASTLGLNRALLYNDREGYLEVFRPYARPGNEWLEEVGRQFAQNLQVLPSQPSRP